MDYGYQSEKLSAARHALMLPHIRGVEESIDEAFRECTHGFHRMDESGFNDNARFWVSQIKEFMRAPRPLSTDQQIELSRIIDELAHWFDRHFWTEGKA